MENFIDQISLFTVSQMNLTVNQVNPFKMMMLANILENIKYMSSIRRILDCIGAEAHRKIQEAWNLFNIHKFDEPTTKDILANLMYINQNLHMFSLNNQGLEHSDTRNSKILPFSYSEHSTISHKNICSNSIKTETDCISNGKFSRKRSNDSLQTRRSISDSDIDHIVEKLIKHNAAIFPQKNIGNFIS
jgi:hypothetical protein